MFSYHSKNIQTKLLNNIANLTKKATLLRCDKMKKR